MKFSSRGLLITIGLLLLFLLVIAVSLGLALGLFIGLGWLMTLFLPFTLFEASLLASIASTVVGMLWFNLLQSKLNLGDEDEEEDYADIDDEMDSYDHIPASRFYKGKANKTWEALFRYRIADSVYQEFQDSPQPVAPIGEKQLQELAIRLADLAIDLLKKKPVKSQQFQVTVAQLKRQMAQMEQRPYDDHILKLAVIGINKALPLYYPELLTVIQAGLWDMPCSD